MRKRGYKRTETVSWHAIRNCKSHHLRQSIPRKQKLFLCNTTAVCKPPVCFSVLLILAARPFEILLCHGGMQRRIAQKPDRQPHLHCDLYRRVILPGFGGSVALMCLIAAGAMPCCGEGWSTATWRYLEPPMRCCFAFSICHQLNLTALPCSIN